MPNPALTVDFSASHDSFVAVLPFVQYGRMEMFSMMLENDIS